MATDPGSTAGPRSTMTVARAVSLGIGAMVGAGIFALLGEVGAVASSSVWLAFLVGGAVALLNGYSYGRFGARYPSAGGPVDFLTRGYGVGVFAGGLSIFYYAAGVIGMAMVARAFGSYGSALISPGQPSTLLPAALAATAVVAVMLVNAYGSGSVGTVEVVVVAIKLSILAVFVVGGAFGVRASLFSAEFTVSSPGSVLAASGFAFFAYTGFGIVTNTAGEMAHPARDLPRALTIAIGAVIVLYISIALVAFGSLPVSEIVKDKEVALAAAARPVFGSGGFTIMAIAALISTLSALNAGLYGSTNISYILAKEGELPEAFDQRSWRHAPEGLYISAGLVLLLATVLDLSQVASLGGLAALLVYLAVDIGHLKLRSETGAQGWLLLLTVAATAGITMIFVARMATEQPVTLAAGVAVLGFSFVAEAVLRRFRGRSITPGQANIPAPRTDDEASDTDGQRMWARLGSEEALPHLDRTPRKTTAGGSRDLPRVGTQMERPDPACHD